MQTFACFMGVLACTGLSATHAFAADIALADAGATGSVDARVQALLVKVKKTLRPLKAGTFDMGDWGSKSGLPYDMDAHSKPLHKVTLDGFSIMAYKVTYDDFDVFTDATGNQRINMDETDVGERMPKRPAGVSWHGGKEYCQWLGKLTGLPVDLPTEAQWEYAARSGGKRILFATNNGKIERLRNYPKESERGMPFVPEVGDYPPNPAGIYGMAENTQEWVQDWFAEDYYKYSPTKNPLGPATGTEKVQRGSVGGKPEISGMVFMRTKAIPQTMTTIYPDGPMSTEKSVPFPGYSSYPTNNFRCVLNSN